MPAIRLNKLLSQSGVASRRAADRLITEGRVDVNGVTITALGAKADPSVDEIRVDARRVKRMPARVYLLVNKPRGVVSTRADPERRSTVVDLAARAGLTGYLYPVGRLDYDSEGLMILTNDGAFAERVSHPRYELARTYEIQVAGIPDAHDIERLRVGMTIEGTRTRPTTVRLVRTVEGKRGPHGVLEMTLHEGRNRQVRRMCDAIGHPVDRLRRVAIGPVSDRRLKPGEMRALGEDEIRLLTKAPAPARTRPRPTRARRPPKPPR